MKSAARVLPGKGPWDGAGPAEAMGLGGDRRRMTLEELTSRKLHSVVRGNHIVVETPIPIRVRHEHCEPPTV